MTHGDVPDTFAVGFVVAGEAFAGYDARVCDQMTSAEESGPEGEQKIIPQSQSTAV